MRKTKKQAYIFSIVVAAAIVFSSENAQAVVDASCYCADKSATVVKKVNTADANSCEQECANAGAKYFDFSTTIHASVQNALITKVAAITTPANNITSNTASAGNFKYILLETLPGFFQAKQEMTDLPALILAIYKFGIWTIGIAGLFMLTIGGIMYVGSAGNTSTAGTAKDIITDALLGVFAAMVAYTFLYVINPDLVKLNINFSAISLTDSGSSGSGTGSGSGGGGSCQVMTIGPCAVANLAYTFGADAEKMSMICNRESGGNTALLSSTDLCVDGNSFSVGLYQINIMTSAGSIGCDGGKIFTGIGSRSNSYDCLEHKTNDSGVTYCAHRNCRVVDMAKYNECKAKLENGTTNIQVAGALYKAGHFSPWNTSAGRCNVN